MRIRGGSFEHGAVARMRRVMPRGHTLPTDELRRRNRALLVLLWLHAILVPLWGVERGIVVRETIAGLRGPIREAGADVAVDRCRPFAPGPTSSGG
jgi:hypothetical protein